MIGRQLSRAEGALLDELSYEVDFAALPSSDDRCGERPLLVASLANAERDMTARADEVYCSAQTDREDAREVQRESRYQMGIGGGYATLGRRLKDSAETSVPFTFSELVLSIEALRVTAETSPFWLERNLWRPPSTTISDYAVRQKALQMSRQMIKLCDKRQLEDIDSYFNPWQLTRL